MGGGPGSVVGVRAVCEWVQKGAHGAERNQGLLRLGAAVDGVP